MESKLSALSITSKPARMLSRFFLGSAVSLQTDSYGRIKLTTELMEHAQITNEVISVGMGKRVEV